MIAVAALAVLVMTGALLSIPVLLVRQSRQTALIIRLLEEQERARTQARAALLNWPAKAPRAHHPKSRMGFTPDRSVERERA